MGYACKCPLFTGAINGRCRIGGSDVVGTSIPQGSGGISLFQVEPLNVEPGEFAHARPPKKNLVFRPWHSRKVCLGRGTVSRVMCPSVPWARPSSPMCFASPSRVPWARTPIFSLLRDGDPPRRELETPGILGPMKMPGECAR